ncbi:MAG: hypothetical protein K2G99_07685, partial [Desulfovibrio sp.]|nr:hypothetical protein [Desulfovibrio sp.]
IVNADVKGPVAVKTDVGMGQQFLHPFAGMPAFEISCPGKAPDGLGSLRAALFPVLSRWLREVVPPLSGSSAGKIQIPPTVFV